jgi:hypothetical protein
MTIDLQYSLLTSDRRETDEEADQGVRTRLLHEVPHHEVGWRLRATLERVFSLWYREYSFVGMYYLPPGSSQAGSVSIRSRMRRASLGSGRWTRGWTADAVPRRF